MLQGRLENVFHGQDGLTLVLTTKGGSLDDYSKLVNKFLDIDIKEHRERRSMNANSYFHVLVNKIGRAITNTDDEVKHNLVTQYGTIMRGEDGSPAGMQVPSSVDLSVVEGLYTRAYKHNKVNGVEMTCYVLYKPTHLLDTKEMSQLIEGTVNEAKQLGIETMTPIQIKKMMDRYERTKNRNV